MKLFWKHILPGLLLIVLPIAAAQAQSYTDKVQANRNGTSLLALDEDSPPGTGIIAGVIAADFSGWGWFYGDGVGGTHGSTALSDIVQDLNVILPSAWYVNPVEAAGAAILDGGNNFAGTLNFGNITVSAADLTNTASTNPLFGIFYLNDDGNFNGIINAGDITVHAANGCGTGVLLWNNNGGGTNSTANIDGGQITIGNINVTTERTATDGESTGFYAGGLLNGGTLTLGNVTVNGDDWSTVGVHFDKDLVDGSISTGSISATGTGTVVGARFDGTLDAGAGGSVTLNLGSVYAATTGSGQNAYGIELGDSSHSGVLNGTDIIIKHDVIAESADGDAQAIRINYLETDSVTTAVTLDTSEGDLRLSGTGAAGGTNAGIYFQPNSTGDGNTELNITGANTFTNKGADFVVIGANTVNFGTDADITGGSFTTEADTAFIVDAGKSVKLGNTAITTDGNKLTITAADGALFQTAGDVNVGSNLLEANEAGRVELGGSIAAGTTTVSGDGTLAINAGSLAANALGTLTVVSGSTLEVNGNSSLTLSLATSTGDDEDIVTKNSVGKWAIVSGQLTLQSADNASMSDGVLAAAAIHGRHTAWNAVRDHLISGYVNNGNQGFLGQAPCDPCGEVSACNPCDPAGLFAKSGLRTAWVNYVGRADSYQNAYNGGKWRISSDGVQVGSDLYRTKKSQFGVLFGYEGGRAAESLDTVETDDIYLGLYAVRVLRNGADVRAILNYGWQDFTSQRYVGTANTAKYDGNTLELNLEAGKRFFSGNWSVRPAAAFDLYWNQLDAVTETGSNATTYDKSDFTQAFVRFGSDLRYAKDRFTFNSGLYYAYDLNDDKLATRVSAVGLSSTLSGSKLGRSLLTFNVGGEYALGQKKTFAVFGGFTGDSALDRDGDGFQSVGYVGGAWKW
jgi:hypothetical protein